MTQKAAVPVRRSPDRVGLPEGSGLDRLVCTTRVLARQGRPVVATDVDLVAAAGPDGVLSQQGDFGLAGRGVAARLPLSQGLEDESSLREIAAGLRAVPCSSDVAGPGTGPVVLGALPFDRTAAGYLTLPAVVIGRRGGDAWITVVHDRDGDAAVSLVEEAMVAAALGHVAPPAAAAPRTYTLTSVREPAEWEGLIAATVDRIETGHFAKVVLARQVEVLPDRPSLNWHSAMAGWTSSSAPVDVGSMIDECDGDAMFCLVDAVEDAEVAAARAVQTGQFEVQCATHPLGVVCQASIDELDDGGGDLLGQPREVALG